jgi:hypothetical protein
VARRRAIRIADDLPQRHLLGADQRDPDRQRGYIFGLMWMPAVAAILTCRMLGRPLCALGLGTWNGRYVLVSYLIPVA